MSENIKTAYKHYVDCELGDQDKPWAPHIVYNSCYSSLNSWLDYSRVCSLPFAVPMIWHEPIDQVTDCYFCMTSVVGFTVKTRTHNKYSDRRSALKPVPHDDKNPKPKPPEQYGCTEVGLQDISAESTSSSDDIVDPSFMPDYEDLPKVKICNVQCNCTTDHNQPLVVALQLLYGSTSAL